MEEDGVKVEDYAKNGITRAYYDRSRGSIEGLLTIQTVVNAKIVTSYSRLPARSGQRSKSNDSWTYGSPIPFSSEIEPKRYKLWLSGQLQAGQWAGKAGIGEFWRISTEDDRVTIQNPKGPQKKLAVGIHPENGIPGSLACIVLVNDLPAQRQNIRAARKWLKTVAKYHEYIELTVL